MPLLLACGGDDEGTGPDPDPAPVPGAPVAAALDISPAAATLTAIGDTLRLEAEVRDGDAQVMADAAVAWSGLDDGVARVSSTGRVEAVAAGEARIVARSGPAADTAVVEVVQVPAGFEVVPARVRVAKGDTVRLTAAVVDANGFAVEDAADPVVWSSLDESVATVDASGLVTATTQGGETRVVAAAGEWKAAARLRALDRIAFVSDRDGNAEVYVIFADGGGEANLTRDEASDAQPRWSPDGKRIAFLSDRDGNNEIYVMNADGTGVTNVTNDRGWYSAPTWSPDGTRIAFQRYRDDDWDIYVINADGTGLVRLTDAPGNDTEPVWMPVPGAP